MSDGVSEFISSFTRWQNYIKRRGTLGNTKEIDGRKERNNQAEYSSPSSLSFLLRHHFSSSSIARNRPCRWLSFSVRGRFLIRGLLASLMHPQPRVIATPRTQSTLINGGIVAREILSDMVQQLNIHLLEAPFLRLAFWVILHLKPLPPLSVHGIKAIYFCHPSSNEILGYDDGNLDAPHCCSPLPQF